MNGQRFHLYVVGAVVLAACSLCTAGEKKFTPVGIGGGGGILTPSFSPHDTNLFFASSDMSGIYRSTDQGRNWTMLPWRQLSAADTCPVTFHPVDSNTCYCVPGPWSRQFLKVSTDKGITWKNLTEETPWEKFGQVNRIGLSPEGKVILLAAEQATFRSGDGGKTWQQADGIRTNVHGFLWLPIPNVMTEFVPPRWFAGTADGVVMSMDEGKSWTPCKAQPPGGRLSAFCGGRDPKTDEVVLFASVPTSAEGGTFGGGIYRSTDEGQTWVGCMTNPLATKLAGGETVVTGINTTVNAPTDAQKAGGRGPQVRQTAQYPFLDMAANQAKVVYTYCFGNGDGARASTVFKSEDTGRTWRPVLFPADRQMRIGKTSTPDDERDMQEVPAGPAVKGNVDLGWLNLDVCWMSDRILGFAVNPANSDMAAFSNWMEIFLTVDGGKTWRQAYSRCLDGKPARGKSWESIGIEMTTAWSYQFDPHDPQRTYICYTDIGFARSEDRGRSWIYATEGSPWKNTFYDLAFDPDTPGLLYAATAYEHDIPSWKMAENIYGGGAVCVSTNYGKTWKPMAAGLPPKGPCMAVAVDPTSPAGQRTLYCAFYGSGVFKSTDGARSWTAKNAGLKLDRNSHFVDLKRHKDGTLLALCGASRLDRECLGQGSLFKSADGGETWTDLTDDLKLRHPYGFDVDPSDSRIIYIGACAVPRHHDEAGLYKTTDGGAHWAKVEIPWPAGAVSYYHINWPSVDPYDSKRIWVSSATHGVMLTTDAGATWKEVQGIPFRGVSRIAVDPRYHDTIWATTFGGGVWTGPASGTGNAAGR